MPIPKSHLEGRSSSQDTNPKPKRRLCRRGSANRSNVQVFSYNSCSYLSTYLSFSKADAVSWSGLFAHSCLCNTNWSRSFGAKNDRLKTNCPFKMFLEYKLTRHKQHTANKIIFISNIRSFKICLKVDNFQNGAAICGPIWLSVL